MYCRPTQNILATCSPLLPAAQAVTTESEELFVTGECYGAPENRISELVTKSYDSPMPRRSKAPGASATATPRAQLQPHAGPVRPISLHLGRRLLGRATVVQPRYMGRM